VQLRVMGDRERYMRFGFAGQRGVRTGNFDERSVGPTNRKIEVTDIAACDLDTVGLPCHRVPRN
jgi:hypothetical protein